MTALLIIPSIYAGPSTGAGSSSFPFLNIPISARATAMGGTLGATSGDVGTIETNPAGIAGLERTDIQATYINYLQDTSLQSFSFGFPIQLKPEPMVPPLEGVEFSQSKLDFGFEYKLFKANDSGFSATDNPLGDFSVRDQLLALTLAYPILPRLSLGLSGKSISSKIENKSTSDTAFDLGSLYRLNSRWSTGVALQNFGSAKKYNGSLGSAEYPLPLTLRGNVSYKMMDWLLIADLSHSRDSVTRESAGAEWSLNRFINFRGGFFHATTLEFTAGLGVQIVGPQKSAQPVYHAASTPHHAGANVPSPMSEQIMARIADKLIAAYKSAQVDTNKPTLSVLPFGSKESAAVPMHDLLQKQFSKSNEFILVNEGNSAAYIASGNVDRSDDRYSVTARLIRMEDGETIATTHAEIAVEDFYQKKKTLDTVVASPASSNDSHMNIGLDYGLSTLKDFGITHTITLKILY